MVIINNKFRHVASTLITGMLWAVLATHSGATALDDRKDNADDGLASADSAPMDVGLLNEPEPELAILTYSLSLANVQSGTPVSLQWTTQGALSISVTAISEKQDITLSEWENLAESDALTVIPALSTKYRLTAIGPNGAVNSELVVTVPEIQEVTPLWSENIFLGGDGQRIKTSIMITDEGVGYSGSFDGNLYQSSTNGEVSVFYENAGVVLNKPLLTQSGLIFGASASAEYEGRVCSLSFDQTMTWIHDTQSSVIASPVLDEASSTLYVVSYQGMVTALNSDTGQCLWKYALSNEEVCATPVLTDSTTLVVNTLSKTVYSLDLQEILTLVDPNSCDPLAVAGDAMDSTDDDFGVYWSESFGG